MPWSAYIYIGFDLINDVKYYTITLTIESTFVNTFSNCLKVKILTFPQFCCDVNKQI